MNTGSVKKRFAWIGFAYILVIGFLFDYARHRGDGWENLILLTFNTVWMFWLTWFVNFHGVKKGIEKIFPAHQQIITRIAVFFIAGSIISLLIVTLPILMIYSLMGTPLTALWDDVPDFLYALMMTQTIIACYMCLEFLEEWKNSALQAEQLREANVKTQLESLRQQLNPHILFNSMNALKILIREDPKQAEEFVIRLSGFFRHLLRHRDHDKSTIAEELAMLDTYVFMLKARFDENLVIHVHVSEALHSFHLPIITLQLLVENAVKHNVIASDQPLTISISHEDGFIRVENNLRPKLITEQSLKLGLENLKKRYSYFGHSLEVVKTENQFIVRAPILSA